MSTSAWVLVAGAGLVAGLINAVGGGGSLVSFPTLVMAGVSSLEANVTNTVALVPGYVGGVLGSRAELKGQGRAMAGVVASCIIGSAAGVVLLLNTPSSSFDALAPYLIIGACVIFLLQDQLSRLARRGGDRPGRRYQVALFLAVLSSSLYGAYFGAGLGIIVLAVFGILVVGAFPRLNAMKNVVSFVVNTIAAASFAAFGPVQWQLVAIIATGSLGGGYLGATIARKVSPKLLRLLVVTYGCVVAAVMLVR